MSPTLPILNLLIRKDSITLRTPKSKIIVYDDDPLRSFRGAVRLYDMGLFGVYNSLDDYQTLNESFQPQDSPQNEAE